MAPQFRHINFNNREDRLAGYAQVLRHEQRKAGDEKTAMLIKACELLRGPNFSIEVSDFAKAVTYIVRTSDSDLAKAWRELRRIKAGAVSKWNSTENKKENRFLCVVHYDSLAKPERFLRGFYQAWDSILDDELDLLDSVRLQLALTSLVHGSGLLREFFASSFKGQWKVHRPPSEIFLYADDKTILNFLDLSWARALPMKLGDLRNAWVHGEVTIEEGKATVFHPHSSRVRTILTLTELMWYKDCIEASWHAVLLEDLLSLDLKEAVWVPPRLSELL